MDKSPEQQHLESLEKLFRKLHELSGQTIDSQRARALKSSFNQAISGLRSSFRDRMRDITVSVPSFPHRPVAPQSPQAADPMPKPLPPTPECSFATPHDVQQYLAIPGAVGNIALGISEQTAQQLIDARKIDSTDMDYRSVVAIAAVLLEHGALTLRQIEERTGYNRGTINGAIERLRASKARQVAEDAEHRLSITLT